MFNDFMMGPGGPGGMSINGDWINRQTGQKITVRDNIISDEGMCVICSDGSTISMREFSRDYIQASDEIYDESGNVVDSQEVNSTEFMYDLNPLQQNDTTIYNPQIEQQTEIKQNSNSDLIKKIFDKINSKPTLKISLEWAQLPTQEINTLVNFLDVNIDDISDYIYQTYADKESIKTIISNYLYSNINVKKSE